MKTHPPQKKENEKNEHPKKEPAGDTRTPMPAAGEKISF